MEVGKAIEAAFEEWWTDFAEGNTDLLAPDPGLDDFMRGAAKVAWCAAVEWGMMKEWVQIKAKPPDPVVAAQHTADGMEIVEGMRLWGLYIEIRDYGKVHSLSDVKDPTSLYSSEKAAKAALKPSNQRSSPVRAAL